MCYAPLKTVLGENRYATLHCYPDKRVGTGTQNIDKKGEKGYCIKHAQIFLTLDKKSENESWTYDHIKDAYGTSCCTIESVAQRFVMDGMEASPGKKIQENRHRKVTDDVEARICAIDCYKPPEGASR